MHNFSQDIYLVSLSPLQTGVAGSQTGSGVVNVHVGAVSRRRLDGLNASNASGFQEKKELLVSAKSLVRPPTMT